MQVKMTKPGSDRIHSVPAKEVAIYEKKGWSLLKETKKSTKKKTKAVEEAVVEEVVEQLNLDLNEEHS
jgi:RNA:NAD 2'-phosphotransferase (TPT1/KptA family)